MGKKTTEARDVIVEWLKSESLLEKEETIKQNISLAERTNGVIEPLPKLQWFIAVNKPFKIKHSDIKGINSGDMVTLKQMMRATVEKEQIKIIPDYFNKVYFHWIDNLRDWCISRQIWYGHRIPIWYRPKDDQSGDDKEIYCGIEAPKGEGWIQDEDTLDTWFSSGLWTFSTLGWPEKTTDFEFYHPTDVIETAYDILPFWVSRMILMTGYTLGTIPFHNVYIHGMVRLSNGEKMSKSSGAVIDPVDISKRFGTDAERMSLVVANTPGTDFKIDENKVKTYKNFANKIWNITRFILESTKDLKYDSKFKDFSEEDKKLTEERNIFVKDITSDMEEFRFYMASEKIYHYIWHTLADIILEDSKKIFVEGTEEAKLSRKQFLLETLRTVLKILHPFMPFVTEEIWQSINEDGSILMIEEWPI